MLTPIDLDQIVHDSLANPEYAREYVKALEEEYADAHKALNAEIERLQKLLEGRDKFIVDQGLWCAFVDHLPSD